MNALNSFLSSAIVAAVVSGLVAGLFSLRALQTQYKNDYYKMVLDRRIGAYACLERFIVSLKTSVMDYDNKLYHLAFSKGGDELFLPRLLVEIQQSSLWMSSEAYQLAREFNILLFPVADAPSGAIDFAKEHYVKIATLRENLERIVAADMLTLYDVPSFLRKQRRRRDGFGLVNLPRQTPSPAPVPDSN